MGRPKGSKNKTKSSLPPASSEQEVPAEVITEPDNFEEDKILDDTPKPAQKKQADGPIYAEADMGFLGYKTHWLKRMSISLQRLIPYEHMLRYVQEAKTAGEDIDLYVAKKVLAAVEVPKEQVDNTLKEIKAYIGSNTPQLYHRLSTT